MIQEAKFRFRFRHLQLFVLNAGASKLPLQPAGDFLLGEIKTNSTCNMFLIMTFSPSTLVCMCLYLLSNLLGISIVNSINYFNFNFFKLLGKLRKKVTRRERKHTCQRMFCIHDKEKTHRIFLVLSVTMTTKTQTENLQCEQQR